METILVLFLVGVTGGVILLGLTLFAASQWIQRDDSTASLADAARALMSGERTRESTTLRRFLAVYAVAIWLGFMAYVFSTHG